jgi:hypothetical protein
MDPTPAQLSSYTTVMDFFTWSQLEPKVVTAVTKALGIEEADHYRVLAMISDSDFAEVLASLKTDGVLAAPALRAKTVMARGAAYFAVYGKRLGEVVPLTAAAVVPSKVSPVMNKFKLNTVTNQSSDVELVVLDGGAIREAYIAYRNVFGVFPPPDEELTAEQLTALKATVDADLAPYVDFAVWGPHGNRLVRKLKLHGVSFASDGSLIPVEVSGPPDLDQWMKSYMCLRTALVSWRLVDLGRIDQYGRLISRYLERYGQASWLQIYQADVRCRSEHMERIRRRGDEDRAVAVAGGHTHPMDQARPWDWVWAEACKDLEFWRVELEEPALLALTRSARSAPASMSVAGPQPGKRLAMEGNGPALKIARVHAVDGNNFKANRKGRNLCMAFNRGECTQGTGTSCPRDSGLAHQCSRCLDATHGANACPRSDFPAQKPNKPTGKGGGKSSKGKGVKGKGGKSWQY